MKLLIDIDDEDYKRIQDIPDVFNSLASRIYSDIRNGTPLPDKTETVTDFADRCRECGAYQGQILAELRTKYKKRR